MVQAVDGVDLVIDRGETLGVVGESGCGKTVTALSVLKLIAMPPGRIVAGQILWQGRDLVPLGADEMDRHPQQGDRHHLPGADDLAQPGLHGGRADRRGHPPARGPRAGARRWTGRSRCCGWCKSRTPERRVHDYPHQFSGGMRQRVMIAMALSCNPKLLIADEPTTALDVTIQAQILELLQEMKSRFGMAIMLITHAMGVVAETAQRVVVMYAGKVVEEAPVERAVRQSAPPLYAGPDPLDPAHRHGARHSKTRLEAIAGVVPSLLDPPPGCRFAPRCRYAMPACTRGDAAAARDRRPATRSPACCAGPSDRRAMTEPLLRVKDLVKNFAVKGGLLRARGRQVHAVDQRQLRHRAPARRWAWSANPAAASRPPAAASCG